MDIISASEALSFLSRAAPTVWVQRALQWMVLNGELSLYSDRVDVDAYTSIIQFTGDLYQKAGEFSGPKMDEEIRKEFSPDFAEKLVGKDHHSDVYDEPHTVEGIDNIGAIDPGFVLFSEGIDWDNNALKLDWLDEQALAIEWFFPSQDYVGSEFERPTYKVRFSNLSFEARRIELLLPSMKLEKASSDIVKFGPSRTAGRPRKWDWDGALAHVVAEAQAPDGLPTGPGAQAKVEGLIAQWFVDETGNAPAISQIRSRASRVMQMIENARSRKV